MSELDDPQSGPITVVGAGATGGYLTARLADAGFDVVLVARGATRAEVERNGIRITEPDGRSVVARPAEVHEASELAPRGGIMLFCVKGYATQAVMRDMAHALPAYDTVVCLQNGVANEGRLSAMVDREKIVAGVLYIGAARSGPAEIECTASPRIAVGPYEGADLARSTAVGEVFERAGIETRVDPDILSAKWQKYLFNCALNPLTAVAGQRLGEILAHDAGRQLFEALLDEALAAASERRAPVSDTARAEVMETARRMDISSSMAEDLQHGRQLEVDEFTGYVLETLGRDGRAPVTQVLDSLLRLLSDATARPTDPTTVPGNGAGAGPRGLIAPDRA